MQRPATRQSRAFWPMMAVFVLVTTLWLAGGGPTAPVIRPDPPPTGLEALNRHDEQNAAARVVGRALGEPLVTLGLLAAGTGALVYRSRHKPAR